MHQNLSEELQRVYDCSPGESLAHVKRFEQVHGLFGRSFPRTPAHFAVRAPGRVNLIGEHTDYNGYPVLPVAVDRDILFVLAPRTDFTIEVVNEHFLYDRRTFSADFPVQPYQQGDWGNYVKAAVHGILEAKLLDPQKARGFQAVVSGTIPDSAGLSSSSALVVASALAFLAANEIEVDGMELAELLAHAERYVGSEGGGMDQAVSLLAKAGEALRIDFFPLRTESVRFPGEISFVVCNSLIRAPKSESVRYAYNSRVIECRIATALLSKAIAARRGNAPHPSRLADLSARKLGLREDELDLIASEAIGRKPLRIGEIAAALAKDDAAVEKELCKLRDGSILEEPKDGFQVWNRYRHVVTEAKRVDLTVEALRAGRIADAGKLMNQSHASCRDDYEISCPELEALVSIARAHGALGARLTGAGFGGCTANAVPTDRVDDFIRGVTEDYYNGYVKDEKSRPFVQYARMEDVIFRCHATAGAGVMKIEGQN